MFFEIKKLKLPYNITKKNKKTSNKNCIWNVFGFLKNWESQRHIVYPHTTHTDALIVPRVKMHFLHLPVHKTHVSTHSHVAWMRLVNEYKLSNLSHSLYSLLYTFHHTIIHTYTQLYDTLEKYPPPLFNSQNFQVSVEWNAGWYGRYTFLCEI